MHVWRALVKMEAPVWTVERGLSVSVYPPMEETSARRVSYAFTIIVLILCLDYYYLSVFFI